MQNLLQSLHGRVFSRLIGRNSAFYLWCHCQLLWVAQTSTKCGTSSTKSNNTPMFLNPFMFFKHFMWLWTSWKCHQRTTGKFNWHRWCCFCFTCRKGTSHVVTAFITAQATASAEGGGVVQDLPGQRFATSQHAKPSSPTNDQNDVHILKDLYTGESDWLGGFCWVSFSSWNQVEWRVAGPVTIKAWKVWKNSWTKSRWEVEDWIWFQLLGAMEDFEGLARYWNGVHNGNYLT